MRTAETPTGQTSGGGVLGDEYRFPSQAIITCWQEDLHPRQNLKPRREARSNSGVSILGVSVIASSAQPPSTIIIIQQTSQPAAMTGLSTFKER
jgi:hypothetical protein